MHDHWKVNHRQRLEWHVVMSERKIASVAALAGRTNTSYGIACYHLLYHLANVTRPKRRPCTDEQKTKYRFYPYQTKILEGGTKDEIPIFDILFKGVSTRFGQLTIEKPVDNPDFIF